VENLIAIVDNVLALNKMQREADPVQILASARAHLLKRAFFDSGDARAHFVLSYCIAAIKNERRKPSETCQVVMTSDAADQWGIVCGKPSVGSSELCREHLEQNGV